jgi:Outer membrane protein beta-barrel domain
MKTLFKMTLVAIALSTIAAVNAQAQTTDNSTKATATGVILSVGPEAGIPVGSLSDRYAWNFGGSVQADFPIWTNQLYLTTSAGLNSLFVKDNYTVNQNNLLLLPVKAGLRYYPVDRFYIQGEAGASFLFNKNESGYDKTTSFAYSPSVGYQFALAKGQYLDAGVKFEGNTKFTTNGSANNFIGLRLAYSFGLK